MKQYVIDELRPADFNKIKGFLDQTHESSKMDDLYWFRLDDDILSPLQAEHKDCYPFYFAVELQPERVSFELLIRTKNRVRCDCMAYATEAQRNWLIRSVDAAFERLKIKT
ncbi:MAG: hypothetical protein AB1427_20650 [Thermodesulfobacteriota bacterium]